MSIFGFGIFECALEGEVRKGRRREMAGGERDMGELKICFHAAYLQFSSSFPTTLHLITHSYTPSPSPPTLLSTHPYLPQNSISNIRACTSKSLTLYTLPILSHLSSSRRPSNQKQTAVKSGKGTYWVSWPCCVLVTDALCCYSYPVITSFSLSTLCCHR